MSSTVGFINATVTLYDADIESQIYMLPGQTVTFNTVFNSTIKLPYSYTTIENAINSNLEGGAGTNCGTCGITVSGANNSVISPAPNASSTSSSYYSPILMYPTFTGTLAGPSFNATTGTYQMDGANVLLYNGGILYEQAATAVIIGYPGSCFFYVQVSYSAPAVAECGLIAIGPMKASGSGAAVGYATGNKAGCAVTQDTNRTTGVTCNANTGQITLYSAAGSTSYTTFTVTDSSIVSTDTVSTSIIGANNTYNILTPVVATGGGSFTLTFNAVSGTSTDAPVFNFTVMKGSSN
jgi:hypothetical protein